MTGVSVEESHAEVLIEDVGLCAIEDVPPDVAAGVQACARPCAPRAGVAGPSSCQSEGLEHTGWLHLSCRHHLSHIIQQDGPSDSALHYI